MYAGVYTEYVEDGPGSRIYISMPGPGKDFRLVWDDGKSLTFRNRAAAMRWLLTACPDAHAYAWNGEYTQCAGSIRGLCERAGITTKGDKRGKPLAKAGA